MENIVHVNYTRYAHWFSVIILKCVINNSFCCQPASIFHAPVLLMWMTLCHCWWWLCSSSWEVISALTPTYLSFMSRWQCPYCKNDSALTHWPSQSRLFSLFGNLWTVWKGFDLLLCSAATALIRARTLSTGSGQITEYKLHGKF